MSEVLAAARPAAQPQAALQHLGIGQGEILLFKGADLLQLQGGASQANLPRPASPAAHMIEPARTKPALDVLDTIRTDRCWLDGFRLRRGNAHESSCVSRTRILHNNTVPPTKKCHPGASGEW